MKEPGEENDLAGTHGGAVAYLRKHVRDRDDPDLLPDAAAFPTGDLGSSKMDEAGMKLKELNGRLEELKQELERLARIVDAIQIIIRHEGVRPIGSNHDTPIPPATD